MGYHPGPSLPSWGHLGALVCTKHVKFAAKARGPPALSLTCFALQCPVLSDDGSRVGMTQAACASQRRQRKRLLQDLLANTQVVCVLCVPVCACV